MITFFKHLILVFFLFLLTFDTFAQVQIGLPINLPNSVEKSPSISLDGKQMVYISNENGNWQLFETYLKTDGTWDDPVAIDSVNKFSIQAHINHPCYSADAQRIYYSADFSGGKGGLDIYYSDFVNGGWSKPINLGEPVNSSLNDDMPSISADGQVIYFTRTNFDRKDDLTHCFKIWYSERTQSNIWNVPKMLPEQINAGCEASPRILSNGRTLIFASQREDKKQLNPNLKPKGGYDLYVSEMTVKNIWTSPKLLFQMNTEADEYATTYCSGTKMIYYSSIREVKSQTNGGIYSIKVPDSLKITPQLIVSGVLLDGVSSKPLSGVVKVIDAKTHKEIGTFHTSAQNGSYYICLNGGTDYIFDFTANNYTHFSKTFEYGDANNERQEKLNVKLFNFAKFKLKVYNAENHQALNAMVKISAQSPTQLPDLKIVQDGNACVLFQLPVNKKYILQVEAPNVQKSTLTIDLSSDQFIQNFEIDVPLIPARETIEVNITDQNGQAFESNFTAREQNNLEEIFSAKDASNLVTQIGVGKFTLKLQLGQVYWIEAIGSNQLMTAGEWVEVSDLHDKKINIKVAPMKPLSSLLVREIKFIGNSADLKPSSDFILKKICKQMLEITTIKFEINAYCNDKPLDEIVDKLSLKRAEVVADYLMERGVKANRLKIKGNGKKNPIASNENDVDRAKNERIELKFIE